MNKISFFSHPKKHWRLMPVVAFLVMLFFNSCEDYLDINKYVYDQTTMDSIFLSKARTEQYINGAAELLYDESLQTGTDWGGGTSLPCGAGADEAIIPFMLNSNSILYDEITESNTKINPWSTCYKGIRKANIVLANIHRNIELTEMEKRDFMGRAYFLRAYFYFYLVRLYGPVPVLPDEPFATDMDIADASYERSTYDECVEKICTDFEQAASMLPLDRIEAEQYMPTRGAALAFKARMQLYAASPLFNGNTYYADWVNSKGEHFISQTEDKSKWAAAAATYKRIIDMGKYELHTVAKIVNDKGTGTLTLPTTVSSADFPDGAGDIDPYKSYRSVFDGTYQPYSVKEYIYYCRRSDGDDRLYFPSGIGGNATFSVTQDMIDEYRMADGRAFSEATEAEKSYKAVGSSSTFALEYQLSSNRACRDDNREPRYYATIGFNYCIWPGTSYRGTENLKNREVTYYEDGNAKDASNNNYRNRTGYTCRKYIHQEDIGHWNSTKKSKVFPLARYAEVLLGYAEAMNEMDSESFTDEKGNIIQRNPDEMVKYFNQVRYRAGQPGITIAEASDYETMKKLVKHEWQIEFAFENRRYWDLRRWKDAYDAYNKPIRGLDVSAKMSQREQFYTIRVWNTEVYMKRMFSNKMYFWPIDRNVLQKNGKLVQNPGWN